ncbi:MAG: Ppx/GppA phosphatase family protein, partial [Tepidisphaeraceae bacterium]
GLDRSHASVVTDLRCRIEPKRVRIAIQARSDAELEIWGARRKMGLFSRVFDRDVVFDRTKS